ncbi:MAG: complex I NDUFA9 subunit family protein, partial [Rhodospirillaceae bacterium]|nr:complex I NDUFA9 subunit family protein [Rhodospirillaceae bacterium]
VFGPEDDFFNRFARMAMISPALPLIGGGHTKFQPVYVGDVAAAVEKVLNDPATAGRTYELGGPRVYSFADLLRLMLSEIGRCRLLIPMPFALARLKAAFLQLLPVPPLTVDQVRLLQRDNVVSPQALTLKDLGLPATAAEAVLPTYLDRYRPRGHYSTTH